jgi:glyoxylate reductase
MRILVTHKIVDEPLRKLREYFDVDVLTDQPVLSKSEIIHALKQKEYAGMLTLLSDPIDAEVIQAAGSSLKIIANYAVGYNNIDLKAAKKKNILVLNTPDVLTDATADLTWALILAVARKIPQADSFTRKGKFEGWAPELFLGMDLYEKTLGVVGAGRIGTAVIKRSMGWNMNILYSGRSENKLIEQEFYAKKVDLDTLMKESDIITLHCPLTEETRHLIGEREIKLMKPSAIFINTARGPVVDEKALIQALKEKQIFGAGFDVYEEEPHIPKELLELDNVVILPHIGSGTYQTRRNMGYLCVNGLIDYLIHQTVPDNVVE